MQSSYRCLQSFLAALNGAQSSVCCHCSGTQPSTRTTMMVNYPWLHRCGVYLLYISMVMIIYAIISSNGGKSGLTPGLKDPYGSCSRAAAA